MATESFFKTSSASYQRHLKIIDAPEEPTLAFPLVLAAPDGADLPAVLEATSALGPQPNQTDHHSSLRKMLDANGGAINFKNMPLKTAQEFSDWVSALAGKGDHALVPHEASGMAVQRRPHAKHVLTTNEGPPSQLVIWHNEFAAAPSHPHYVMFFYLRPPGGGGQTPLTSAVAVYDRLKKQAPEFLEGCKSKGVVYNIPHTAVPLSGIMGGNGVYHPEAFGPLDGVLASTEEERRRAVEVRIKELAQRGGWYEGAESNEALPNWQRRGFSWKWDEEGGVMVTQRVPAIGNTITAVLMHPTLSKGVVFGALATIHAYAKANNTFEPPHTYKTEDGKEAVSLPPMFVEMDGDKLIPRDMLETHDRVQHELMSEIEWEQGDVIVVDNYAVQHARWAWEGDRMICVSFWDDADVKGTLIP